jgi:lambda family phage portal protein
MGISPARHTAFPAVRNSSDFKGAQSSNFWDWVVSPTTIDYQIRTNLYRLRANARDLALNNPIVRQYLQLLAQNVIGPKGIRLQAQVRNNDGKLNKGINNKIEFAWADFWDSPFVDGKMSGVSGEQTLIKSVARDGEIFVRMCIGRQFNRHAFALQIIDPDLVDHTYNRPRSGTQNEVRLGIEVDEWGRSAAVWIWNSYPQDINSGTPHQRTRIPAAEILHVFDPERANQSRGFTWINSVMLPLQHMDGFMEAALVAARTGACAFPIFEQNEMSLADENAKDFRVELNPGSGFALPAGLKVSNYIPTYPNIAVGDFIKAELRFFSSGMHVSYNALSNDLEGVNYSSIRSGLLIERDRWMVLQQWWISEFRQKVYEAWLPCSMLSGALVLDSRDPAKFMAVKWTPRGWKWVDPLKDVNAAVIAIENGLASRTSILGEKGEDFEDTCEELADEKNIAEAAGLDFSGAAVSAKDVLKQAEDEELATPAAAPAKTNKSTKTKAQKQLRLIALATLLDDEEVDAERARQLMAVYREGK